MSSQRIVDLRNRRPVRRESSHRAPSRESDRRSPLRTRRRRNRFLIGAGIALLCILLAYGVHALSYADRLSIHSVRIEGADKVPPEVVISLVHAILDDGQFHFLSRRNIFLYPKHVIENAVSADFPRVASAQVSRAGIFSRELTVRILEREPFSKWCAARSADSPQACFFMDERGYVFAEASESERADHAYVFEKGLVQPGATPIGAVFSPGHVPGIVAMMRYLEQADFTPVRASIENEQDFYVYLSEGFFIKASYGQDAAQLVRNLELILSSETLRNKEASIEYIDLRFGNRVYYKLKGESESPAQ